MRLKGIRTIHTYIHTSDVLEHKWRASLKTILLILTSNTEATGNKVQFLNLAYRVKGFQCQLSATAWKEKNNNKTIHVI